MRIQAHLPWLQPHFGENAFDDCAAFGGFADAVNDEWFRNDIAGALTRVTGLSAAELRPDLLEPIAIPTLADAKGEMS